MLCCPALPACLVSYSGPLSSPAAAPPPPPPLPLQSTLLLYSVRYNAMYMANSAGTCNDVGMDTYSLFVVKNPSRLSWIGFLACPLPFSPPRAIHTPRLPFWLFRNLSLSPCPGSIPPRTSLFPRSRQFVCQNAARRIGKFAVFVARNCHGPSIASVRTRSMGGRAPLLLLLPVAHKSRRACTTSRRESGPVWFPIEGTAIIKRQRIQE